MSQPCKTEEAMAKKPHMNWLSKPERVKSLPCSHLTLVSSKRGRRLGNTATAILKILIRKACTLDQLRTELSEDNTDKIMKCLSRLISYQKLVVVVGKEHQSNCKKPVSEHHTNRLLRFSSRLGQARKPCVIVRYR